MKMNATKVKNGRKIAMKEGRGVGVGLSGIRKLATQLFIRKSGIKDLAL